MVNSRYQPTSTASTPTLPDGGSTSKPASASGPVRPSVPSTITRAWRRRVSTSRALTTMVAALLAAAELDPQAGLLDPQLRKRRPALQPAQEVQQRLHLRVVVPPCRAGSRSEEHTSELQSRENLVCRLLLE